MVAMTVGFGQGQAKQGRLTVEWIPALGSPFWSIDTIVGGVA